LYLRMRYFPEAKHKKLNFLAVKIEAKYSFDH